jgi:hypothetical protein
MHMLRAIVAGSILTGAALASQIVEGRVVNSATGGVIAGVAVHLSQGGKVAYSAKTDAEGRFRIESVQDGVYIADYKASGFWSVPNILDRGTGRPIAVASGSDPVRLEVKMPPIAKLSGRVLDGSGKPVAGASLFLAWEDRWCRPPACVGLFRTVKSDEKGEYTIADLDLPGRWLLSAAAPPSWKAPESDNEERQGWTQTFYPGVADAQLASEVVVRPGGDLWNMDIKLATAPLHWIRGRVLGIDGDPVPKAAVTLAKRYGAASVHQETRSDGAFEFEVASVTGDEWSLSTTWDQGGAKLWAAETVEIKRRDPENFELRLTAPFSVQGRIVMDVPEGRPAPKRPGVMLTFDAGGWTPSRDAGFRFVAANADARGDLTIKNVYAGPYQIALAEPPDAPYYLDSIRLGDRDATAGVEIVSPAQTLTVTYKFDGGTVRGTIEDCVGIRVLLVPQDPSLRREGFMRYTSCGQDGRFEFSAVRPGEYYGFAIAGNDGTPWYQMIRDEEVLKQAGRVTVRAKESTVAEIKIVTR